MVAVVGLKMVAVVPWKRTARSPAQILLMESRGMETSLKRCASQDVVGSSGMLRLSFATEAMILPSATWADGLIGRSSVVCWEAVSCCAGVQCSLKDWEL